MIRERIQAAQVEAMKARDVQTATIRLMMAAIKIATSRRVQARPPLMMTLWSSKCCKKW